MTPSWENVAPLVLRTTLEGRNVAVVFRCPETGERVASRGMMAADNAPGQAVSTIGWQVRSAVANEVSRMLGGGLLGQFGRQSIDSAMRPVTTGRRDRVFDEQDQRDAIVRAFHDVRSYFVADGGRWVAASRGAVTGAATAHAAFGARAPAPPPPRAASSATWPAASQPPAPPRPTGATWPAASQPPAPPRPTAADPLAGLDPALVARLLLRVAHADGALDAGEEALLATIADGVPADAPAPTVEELRQVPAPAREPLWRLAASLAVADGELGPAEQAALAGLAEHWQISHARRSSLDREAREHAVLLALRERAEDGELSPADLSAVTSWALRLGVPAARVRALAVELRR